MILVGHNDGNGYRGVFARLKRLEPGRKVHVINSAGETSTYEVKAIKNLKLSKNSSELALQLSFLSTGGSERLTLVGCSDASTGPCQERIYVVAEPVE